MARTQWRCFHCNQVFSSHRAAGEHFGYDQFTLPACRLSEAEGHLLTYIRKLESEIQEYRNESHETLLAAYSIETDARSMARIAGETGYDKGVSDTLDMLKKEQSEGREEGRVYATRIYNERGEVGFLDVPETPTKEQAQ